MSLFVVLIGAGIGYGAWEFFRPLPGTAATEVTPTTKRALTKADVQKILDGLDERARAFEARRGAPLPTKDPS